MISLTMSREDWRTGSIPELPLLRMQKFKTQKGASMAETLRTHRERAKLTQKEVAEMIGVTPNTINNWEKDSSNLKDFYTKKFMEIYKVTYDDIFLGKEHRISVPLLNKHAS